MVIFGEDYGFMLTVGASAAISDLCPDGDLTKIGDLLEGKTGDVIRFTAQFIVEMAKGFDDAKRFAGEEITHRPLTIEMVMALPSDVFKEAQAAAISAFRGDTKTTVEVAPPKKEENRQEKE